MTFLIGDHVRVIKDFNPEDNRDLEYIRENRVVGKVVGYSNHKPYPLLVVFENDVETPYGFHAYELEMVDA